MGNLRSMLTWASLNIFTGCQTCWGQEPGEAIAAPRPEIYGAHRPVVSPRFDPYRVTIDIYRDIRPSDLPGLLALALAMARVFTPALSDFSPTHRPLFSVFLMTASELRSLGRGAAESRATCAYPVQGEGGRTRGRGPGLGGGGATVPSGTANPRRQDTCEKS